MSDPEPAGPSGPAPEAAPPRRNLLMAAISQLRPKQWTKNVLFLPAAIVFAGRVTEPEALLEVAQAVAAFCLLSSSGYVLNDYLDVEADRLHPKKKHRPIASGDLPVPAAWVLMAVVFVGGVALAWALSPAFLALALMYLATTLSYSFYFKHVVILDVMFLASGFVWRTVAGAVAIEAKVSLWLFLCTAFLALFLGFNKRRAELVKLGASGGTRKNLAQYSERSIEEFQSILTACTVFSYSLYAVMGPNPWMAVTIPFVLYGVFRYIWLVEQKGEGGAPDETLLSDGPLLFTVVLFAAVALAVTMLGHQGLLPPISPEKGF